jgi:NADPH2:quinone reductase
MTAQIPERMTTIAIREPGGPEVLAPAEVEVPRPGPGEVLIKVAAAGVNRPDAMQRAGLYPPPPGAPETPGLEVAGEIVALGGPVERWQLGDRVTALVAGGGYADYSVAPAPQCLPIPDGLDLVQAASLPETFFTVWSNVFDRGALKDGERFLVHGGSSGIGTTAIQMAKAWGAEVYTTAGSAEKCRVCEKLGADLAVNYREADFVEAIKAATGGAGVDVILDMVGGDYIAKNLALLAPDGRLCFIAFLQGSKAEVNFMPVLIKRLTIGGSTLRPRPVAFKAAIARNLEQRIWPLIGDGRIRPVIHQSFPLAEAAEAHRLMESSAHIGKIMLIP